MCVQLNKQTKKLKTEEKKKNLSFGYFGETKEEGGKKQ